MSEDKTVSDARHEEFMRLECLNLASTMGATPHTTIQMAETFYKFLKGVSDNVIRLNTFKEEKECQT